MYGDGISIEGELIDLGVKYDLINKSGAWFSYSNVRIGQGRENDKQYIKNNPSIATELAKKIKEKSLSSGSIFSSIRRYSRRLRIILNYIRIIK